MRGDPLPDQLEYSIGSGAELQKLLRFPNDMLITKIAIFAHFCCGTLHVTNIAF